MLFYVHNLPRLGLPDILFPGNLPQLLFLMSYLIFNLIKMRGNLAEGIFAITKEKRELIAEMARQMGICYAFKA